MRGRPIEGCDILSVQRYDRVSKIDCSVALRLYRQYFTIGRGKQERRSQYVGDAVFLDCIDIALEMKLGHNYHSHLENISDIIEQRTGELPQKRSDDATNTCPSVKEVVTWKLEKSHINEETQDIL